MTRLPRVASLEPVEIPPAEAASYPDHYPVKIVIRSDPNTGTKMTVESIPYNWDTRASLSGPWTRWEFPGNEETTDDEGNPQTITTIEEMINQFPLVGQAMGLFTQVVGLAMQRKELKKNIAFLTAAGEDVTAYQDSLAQVEAALSTPV